MVNYYPGTPRKNYVFSIPKSLDYDSQDPHHRKLLKSIISSVAFSNPDNDPKLKSWAPQNLDYETGTFSMKLDEYSANIFTERFKSAFSAWDIGLEVIKRRYSADELLAEEKKRKNIKNTNFLVTNPPIAQDRGVEYYYLNVGESLNSLAIAGEKIYDHNNPIHQEAINVILKNVLEPHFRNISDVSFDKKTGEVEFKSSKKKFGEISDAINSAAKSWENITENLEQLGLKIATKSIDALFDRYVNPPSTEILNQEKLAEQALKNLNYDLSNRFLN